MKTVLERMELPRHGEIDICDIHIGDRDRSRLKRLDELVESMRELGQLSPVILSGYGLVSGYRRIRAAQKLGMTTVSFVRSVDQEDAAGLLKVELQEETCHLPRTASQILDLGRRIEAIERPKAAARKRDGQCQGGRQSKRGEIACASTDAQAIRNPSDAAVGEALGISKSHYQRLKYVHAAITDPNPAIAALAQEMAVKLDRGDVGASRAAMTIREARGGSTPRINTPIPITRKTGPQRQKARTEARNSWISTAIALQSISTQLSRIPVTDLEIGEDDTELLQAIRIITDSIKTIAQLGKAVQHEHRIQTA